jgi:hypothetical protein
MKLENTHEQRINLGLDQTENTVPIIKPHVDPTNEMLSSSMHSNQ